jgi:hypothetical protein
MQRDCCWTSPFPLAVLCPCYSHNLNKLNRERRGEKSVVKFDFSLCPFGGR